MRLFKKLIVKLETAGTRYKLRAQLIKARRNGEPIRLVIGSGHTTFQSWYSTDIAVLDITSPSSWSALLEKETVDTLLAEHVWEHLSAEDGSKALQNCFDYLKPGGVLRLAVPDGYHPSPEYINYVRPGGTGPGASSHLMLYNYRALKEALERCGFAVDLLEYFDEYGKFTERSWRAEDGLIRRTAHHDKRNLKSPLSYTSLLVDAIKPAQPNGS